MRRLPIGPEEAFVLSRVDGRTTQAEIVYTTGLDTERVHECLRRLESLGAITYAEPSAEPAAANTPGADQKEAAKPAERRTTTSSRLARPAIEAKASEESAPTALPSLYDPAELDEPVDLDLARKRRILDLFYRLDTFTHYEVLGVTEDAEKKAVKNAYFELVTFFHPDKYFGKQLGTFKPKLERVFNRLTEAHDVLTRNKTREEYDAYLRTQRKNREIERLIVDEQKQAADLDRVRREIEEEAMQEERTQHAALRGVPTTPGAATEPQLDFATPAPGITEPPASDPEARRRALARKFRSLAPPRPSTPPAAAPVEERREGLASELKRRYEQRLSNIRSKQVEHHVAQADDALRANNVVAAANALRIAASLSPHDERLAARLEDVQREANAELAKSYIEQAQYEEKCGRHVEAARSYELAARGRPSALLFYKVAQNLLQAQSDLKRAGEYARKAVNAAPSDVDARLTLAQIYLAAGMRQSAVSEFERVSAIAPNDERVRAWIKRVRRGDV